jgi:cyclopropane-fatty-acyl-phospholipid synthase
MKQWLQQKTITYFFSLLEELQQGTLTIISPDNSSKTFIGDNLLHATMHIHDWSVLTNAAKRGDIGLGEDYIEGKWDSPDIGLLIELFLRNMHCFDDFAHGNAFNRAIFRIINLLRSNGRNQSKRNIKAHYDVGNDFYQLWLDESMTYSSALYQEGAENLADAQQAKYQRMIDIIAPEGAKKHILEIGSGWGGFLRQAARQGHHVTSLTISPSQYAFAKQRIIDANISDNVALKLQDYRDETGSYDAIISIEMFEAVGEHYWGEYFRAVKAQLKQQGVAVIQTITIADRFFEDYRLRSDFIRQYTFPGGLLPSLARFTEEAGKAGLICRNTYAFGKDYARTLSEWLHHFDANRDKIQKMGYSDGFIRNWRFYLSMCIGSFNAERTDVIQVELVHAS